MPVRIEPGLGEALARGATLPFEWYTSPEVFRLEQERIFRNTWQYVGHTAQVEEPGSYFASRAGVLPVVVTRAADGELRGFVNVCRHRGFPVVQGEGRRQTLQCGYHAWTYDLEGRLRSAPRSEREAEFAAAELSLLPVQVATWGPFVLVNPDLGAPPLAKALGRLPELLAQVVDVGTLRFHHRAEWRLETNWKAASENFLECYHCAVAHPGFTELVDVSPDSYRLEADGLYSSQFGPLRPGARGAFADGEVARSQFHFLWPNLGLNVFPGRPNLSIGPMLPVAPERTERFLDYFFGPDVGEDWIAELLELDERIGREDTALVEGVQEGLRAGVVEQGRLMVASEPLIQHFQRLTYEALRREVPSNGG